MAFIFNKPRLGKGTLAEQVGQINTFLHLLVQKLEYQFNSVEKADAESDAPAEKGDKIGWRYRKYRDGTFEMFGVFNVQTPWSFPMGTLYKSSEIEINIPFNVNEVIVTGCAPGDCWITNGMRSRSNAISFNLMSYKNIATNQDIKVGLHVCGKYML